MAFGIAARNFQHVTFRFAAEAKPGDKWRALFAELWPAYREWFCASNERTTPSVEACRSALQAHMPELVPIYDRARILVGDGETQSRFLSLYCPPAYEFACSQAVWTGPSSRLVRNYDYRPESFDAIVMRTRWLGKAVIGMTDCLMGLLDGVNEDGLAISLTSGGRRIVGRGFGITLILRYVLETCSTVADAVAVLQRLPSHMAYNVTVLDRDGRFATVAVAPDQDTGVTDAPVATNHQAGFERDAIKLAGDTLAREAYLLEMLAGTAGTPISAPDFTAAFLQPPLYCSQKANLGFTTLYTAAYEPLGSTVEYHWPGESWTLSTRDLVDADRTLALPT